MSTPRLVSAVLAAGVVAAPALPAAAAPVAPRPPVRPVTAAATTLACHFRQIDRVDAALDAVAAPSLDTVMLAGRAPAGGAHAWTLTRWGRLSDAFTTPEDGEVGLSSATDGTTVLGGRYALRTWQSTEWAAAPYPAGVTGTSSVAALPGGRGVALVSTGRVLTTGTASGSVSGSATWTTLPALPGRTVAVAADGATPLALTVRQSGATQTVGAWAYVAGRWAPKASATLQSLPALTTTNVHWAPSATGGVVAVNGPAGLAGVADLDAGRTLGTSSLGVRDAVTGARRLPDGRVLLAHARPAGAGRAASGSLSLVLAGRQAAVKDSAGAPVTGLATTAGRDPRIVVSREQVSAGAVSTAIEACA